MKIDYILILMIFLLALSAEGSINNDGLYMRMNLGAGKGYTTYEGLFEFEGLTGLYSIQVGSSISNNLIIYGKFGSSAFFDPEFTLKGNNIGTFRNFTSYVVTVFGAGATYYLPDNYYLSGSIDLPMSDIHIGDTKGSTDIGLGTEITFGKDLWNNKDWWLGVALTGQFSGMMKDQGDFFNNDVSNTFLALIITVTYN